MTVREIYVGSDGEATLRLYAQLQARGPIGEIALNVFRATKCSERAKTYRGGNQRGSYRSQAYNRKEFSINNLCSILSKHQALRVVWGWQHDPATPGYEWVLYVEMSGHGQGSWHTARRGEGPDYPGVWDGIKDVTAERTISWCEELLRADRTAVVPTPPPDPATAQTRSEGTPPCDEPTWCPRCCVYWHRAHTGTPRCVNCGTPLRKPAQAADVVRQSTVAEWS